MRPARTGAATIVLVRHSSHQPRSWTKEDVRTLKTLAREKTKTTAIARKLERTEGATRQQAKRLGVTLGGGRKKA
jgi:GAF domain-containing protein